MSLRVEGVGFRYPGAAEPVLRGCGFAAEGGRVTALLGRNGSGKSTLLRVALGLLKPDSGEVWVNGRPASSYTRSALSRVAAYVPQEEALRLPYRVEEYLLMAHAPHLGLLEQPSPADAAAVDRVLTERGLIHLRGRLVQQLSGGEGQLIRVLRALIQEPRLLVLDEPGSHLDLGRRGELLRLLRGVAAEGRAVLFTTQDPAEALHAADRVVVLDAGKVACEGQPAEVLTGDVLTRLYGVGVSVIRFEGRLLLDFAGLSK